MGDVMAAAARPTRINKAPAIPLWVSENPYGVWNCVSSEENELKKPTYTAKGKKSNQNGVRPVRSDICRRIGTYA